MRPTDSTHHPPVLVQLILNCDGKAFLPQIQAPQETRPDTSPAPSISPQMKPCCFGGIIPYPFGWRRRRSYAVACADRELGLSRSNLYART